MLRHGGDGNRGRASLLLLSLFAALLLFGCSDGKTPEDRIREMLAAAEIAAEERSLLDFQKFIADDYSDGKGRGKRDVTRVAAGYFLRNKSVHILTQVKRIDLLDEHRARVELFAGMSSMPASRVDELLAIRADLHRFDLELEERNGEWLVISAKWRRAGREDFL
ncbi:MAG: hypothetical protein ABW090_02370 [Sedimenticola sp.]